MLVLSSSALLPLTLRKIDAEAKIYQKRILFLGLGIIGVIDEMWESFDVRNE